MARFEPGNQIGRRWKPGQSGNPRGRPRVKPLRVAALRLLEGTDDDGRNNAESAIAHIYDMAMSRIPRESIKWARLLIEITDGKPGEVDDDDGMSRTDEKQTAGGRPGHEPE